MSKKFVALNVFYGDEDYLLNRSHQKALAWDGRHALRLDGLEASETDLISSMGTLPFDGGGVVVVLDNAESLKLTKTFLEYLDQRYPSSGSSVVDTSTVLVAIVRSKTLPKPWAQVAARGRTVEHLKFKPWDEASIEARVVAEAKLLDLKLGDGAFATLHKVYADDTGGMVNELNKLAFLVGKAGTVTRDHVLSVCSRQVPVMPWDISEAASRKDHKAALTYTGLLFKYEGEGASVPIVAALMRQVERLLLAKSLADAGRSSKEIASSVNLPPFVYEKSLAPAVRKHSVEGLTTQMQKLCDLETRIKGSAPSKRTLVELAVLSLAE